MRSRMLLASEISCSRSNVLVPVSAWSSPAESVRRLRAGAAAAPGGATSADVPGAVDALVRARVPVVRGTAAGPASAADFLGAGLAALAVAAPALVAPTFVVLALALLVFAALAL